MNKYLFTSESVTEGHPDKMLIWTRHRQRPCFQGLVRIGHVHKGMDYPQINQCKIEMGG